MKTIKRVSRMVLGALIAPTLAATAFAAPITYDVNRSIGGTGSVTGTITTDGTIGTLGASDITGWNLSLSDGANTFSLASGTSTVYVLGSYVSADASNLYFDYSGANTGLLVFQQGLFSGAHYYCNATASASAYCVPGESVVPTSVFANPGFPRQAMSGTQIVATVAAVPEPASMVLMGLGLLGIAAGRRASVRGKTL